MSFYVITIRVEEQNKRTVWHWSVTLRDELVGRGVCGSYIDAARAARQLIRATWTKEKTS